MFSFILGLSLLQKSSPHFTDKETKAQRYLGLDGFNIHELDVTP